MRNSYLLSILLVASGISGLSAQIPLIPNEARALYNYQMKDRVAPVVVADENLTVNEIYRSPVDGCYFGIGDARNTYDPAGIDCEECENAGGRAKINGSYVWGLTESDKKIYWGTINNLLCQAASMAGSEETANPLLTPYETTCWVCENEKGANGDLLGQLGDMLPPRVFVYDPADGTVRDITPDTDAAATCTGFRSAGSHKGVVFMGGPDFVHGLTLFAYDSENNRFMGASHLETLSHENFKITNIRKWHVIEGVLYCGVKYETGDKSGGAILRWNGSKEDPFNFEIVGGYTEGEASELEYHNGRIYVGGWPVGTTPAGVYRSPLIPAGGFTAADAITWETVWRYSAYENDALCLLTAGVGGFKSYKGQLYWGMLYTTWAYPMMLPAVYGLKTGDELLTGILGVLRSAPLFRATDFSTPEDVELLYGEERLPKYNTTSKEWKILKNGMGVKPKWGRSGLGNLYTNYIWSMEVYNDRLYVGTMDMSNLIKPAIKTLMPSYASLVSMLKLDESKYGYELLLIDDPDTEPTLFTDNGMDNAAAYGVRNMLVYDDYMYVGTANPLNLDENGGWQLFTLKDSRIITGNEKAPSVARLLISQTEQAIQFSLMDGDLIKQIKLIDMNGRNIRQVEGNTTQLTVSLTGLSAGVYIATVYNGGDPISTKVIVR
ncbi:hypothetical protein ACM15_09075 [Parabacteroides goldsteinii]|uniref:T9SS type A sorting domain-containing protein n=1 Tax=Parabacteroides goldsteinii TaxID=328812 RepID=A0A0J6FHI7_9BACT|nr:T9SS type A sorting domain-containing protein [Parabacteroides goldsteinii]KMM33967.1 hypothetical protein ACM15_09075 [Parabacteroides goldsteinii]